MSGRRAAIRALHRARPRSLFLRASAVAFAGLLLAPWLLGTLAPGSLFTERSARNVDRFLERITPRPLRGEPFDLGVALDWAGGIMEERGWEAAVQTLAISVAAIVLTGLAATALSPLAARTLAQAEPWLPEGRPPRVAARAAWRAVVVLVRGFFVLVRAIPEYAWAFILIVLFGKAAWAAVLALALHNTGILGRLTAESIEDQPPALPAALRGLGATRAQIAVAGLFPTVLPRFLLYFFYRWETCVREATILGMLNILSLGYWINLERHALRYDRMVLLVLVGAAIVLLGDFLSAVARRLARRA